jgi:hypothetical protein
MDPAPLLDQGTSGDCLPVPRTRKLSERVELIGSNSSTLSPIVARIKECAERITQWESATRSTLYNWGDIHNFRHGGFLPFSADLIQGYLQLSSQDHRVMMIFRGHEHEFQHLKHNNQVLVTTLPVGMDCPAYNEQYIQSDRAYIIKLAPKVANWQKRAILRKKGLCLTSEITASYPLISEQI